MIDKEKVIKELMKLHGSQETMNLIVDVITLLKEQTPAKPVIDTYFYRCAKCGSALCGRTITEPDNNRLRPKYCSECGQEVNWQL